MFRAYKKEDVLRSVAQRLAKAAPTEDFLFWHQATNQPMSGTAAEFAAEWAPQRAAVVCRAYNVQKAVVCGRTFHVLVVQARDLDHRHAHRPAAHLLRRLRLRDHNEAKRDACYALLKDEALDAREAAEEAEEAEETEAA
jgi:hypothetical protein